MEQDTGRRRSSRLAARGVTTPKTEVVVKKTLKSSEKPKRTKRKINEDIEKLTDAKKTKIEEKTHNEVETHKERKTNDIVMKDVSVVIEMDENNIKANMMLSKAEQNNKPIIEKKPAVISTEPCKQTMDIDEKKEVDVPLESSDENQTETTEEPTKVKEPENNDQKENDVSQDETKQESVCLENVNGKKDEKETVEEEIIKSDIELCVNKDTVTPNGDTGDQEKPANGDEPVAETETIEPITVLQDDTNHIIETDLKAVSIPTIAITASNTDTTSVEGDEKELDKVVNNVVDNMSVTVENNTPNVDQSSTVVS